MSLCLTVFPLPVTKEGGNLSPFSREAVLWNIKTLEKNKYHLKIFVEIS